MRATSFLVQSVRSSAAISEPLSRREAIRFKSAFRPALHDSNSRFREQHFTFELAGGETQLHQAHQLAGHPLLGRRAGKEQARCSLPTLEKRMTALREVLSVKVGNGKRQKQAIAYLRHQLRKYECDLAVWQRWERMMEIRISDFETKQRRLEAEDKRKDRQIRDLQMQAAELRAMSQVLLEKYDEIKLEAYEGTFLLGMRQIGMALADVVLQAVVEQEGHHVIARVPLEKAPFRPHSAVHIPKREGTSHELPAHSTSNAESTMLLRLDELANALKHASPDTLNKVSAILGPSSLQVNKLMEFAHCAIRASCARGHGSDIMNEEYLSTASDIVRGAYARGQKTTSNDVKTVQELGDSVVEAYRRLRSRPY